MSLYVATGFAPTFAPRVWTQGPRLFARTSWLFQVLTLFIYERRLEVDRAARTVTLEACWFWRLRRQRVIPFERVDHIDTRHRRLGGKDTWTSHGWGRSNALDIFQVGLVLRDPHERIRLFNVVGGGAVQTDEHAVIYGEDSLIGVAGDEARVFGFLVARLREYLGVPVGPVEALPDQAGIRWECSACGRPSVPSRTHCQHCGHAIQASLTRIPKKSSAEAIV